MIGANRGSVLLQVLVASALLTIVAMTSATLIYNTSSQNQIEASRSATTPLASAIRTQLSRNVSCVASFAPRPASYSATTEVGLNLGNVAVRAGAELVGYGLRVTSLTVEAFSRIATTNTGNAIYTGDLILRTESTPLPGGSRVAFRPITVSRVSFEVDPGNNLVACNAVDPALNLSTRYRDICASIASADGLQGGWTGTNCVVYDMSAPQRCVILGGTWMGDWCSMPPATFTVSRSIGTGAAGGVWYGVSCPAGSSILGGTCNAASGPMPPFANAYAGNTFYCRWSPGFETSTYTLYAVCAP